jgi:hypothetical protein
VISGPGNQAESAPERESAPPGEFVSDELRADCARFLEELRSQLDRRDEARLEDGWIPASRRT